VVCQREGLRTPELARCYNVISDFTKKTNFRIVGGKMQQFEHLDWIDLTIKKELPKFESSLSRA
ncbi:MAG: hypothetical protein KGJ07_10030, partial [Patescibacteria group bacterium]|nr:hypothetical protein [Patescibacteria group bacterium]